MIPATMLALVTNQTDHLGGRFQEVPVPKPGFQEVLVQVQAISLNRGEVRELSQNEPGQVPGWDAAGVVVQPAEGLLAGRRVVTFGYGGAWAQYRAVRLSELAVLPDTVETGAASTLPVAAVTALRALRMCAEVRTKRLLITGASGGVGRFAVQLARLAGAYVIAQAGSPERSEGLIGLGADQVINRIDELDKPVYAVLETGGDDLLKQAAGWLDNDGLLVQISGSQLAHFTPPTGRLLRFSLGNHLGADLTTLVDLVAQRKIDTQIAFRTDWQQFAVAAQRLLDRQINGKVVLDVSGQIDTVPN